ncbi:hypothetical protein SKAU_G00382610 [Synaphobranchus kaupii]|uniref:Uncharacterized protein n=1 Tax=Synaphobranchus kaupii TaxID=118154 RepID=A0A9Q1EDZ7_SYNKA|nr:hypothetical protein SKAU_G00382610 [Synaphobranchus kaupii]
MLQSAGMNGSENPEQNGGSRGSRTHLRFILEPQDTPELSLTEFSEPSKLPVCIKSRLIALPMSPEVSVETGPPGTRVYTMGLHAAKSVHSSAVPYYMRASNALHMSVTLRTRPFCGILQCLGKAASHAQPTTAMD